MRAAGNPLELSPGKRALLASMLRARGITEPGATVVIPRRAEPGPAPLSFAQRRLWFLERLDPGSPVYNIPLVLRIAGPLAAARLGACLSAVRRRHEALRTVFSDQGEEPLQVVLPADDLAMRSIDLAGLPAAARDREADRLARQEARRPFDLASGPLLRAALLRLGAGEHLLLLSLHHIVCDGWSLSILVRDLAAHYEVGARGAAPRLPALPIQYGDFAVWQRGWLQGEVLDGLLAYWRRQLAGLPGVLELPLDRLRPAVQTFRGDQHASGLDGETRARLAAVAARAGATPNMMVLTAFFAVLARWTGALDIAVGTPVANRHRRQIENLVGFFANTLVLRVDLGAAPDGLAALRRVREATIGAQTHQDLPFERLVEEVRPERSLSHAPLIQVLFTWQSAAAPLDLPGLSLQARTTDNGTVKFDLALAASELDDGRLALALQYNTDLFDADTALRMLRNLDRVLAALAADPGVPLASLPAVDAAERWQLLGEWNATAPLLAGELCLHDRFTAQARRSPDAPALLAGGRRLTYRQLDEAANDLAGLLLARGVGPEARVGIFLPRSVELVVALLAVLRAGGAYLPLEPSYPPARLELMLDDGGARLVVTTAELASRLAGRDVLCVDAAPPGGARPAGASRARPENLAYVIYTSGSSGTPKGVAITHRSAAALVDWAAEVFGAADLACVLAATSICFDLSVFELFVPLAVGGCVVLVENALDLPLLPAEHGVTLINTVPSVAAELVRGGSLPPGLRVVNLAGEPLSSRLVADLGHAGGGCRIFNLYGPSEDTTYSTCGRAEPGAPGEPAIGRPIAGTEAYVLDLAGEPVPRGVAGELFLGGLGLARAYLGRPALTAERFVPDPFSRRAGGRLYATGDLARWRRDGQLEFLGRRDHQVKVRGFRIELGEVDAALLRCPGVAQAATLALEEARGKRLAAFVAPLSGQELDAEGVRGRLAATLPSFMVPPVVRVLPALPLLANGKLDRAALRQLAQDRDAAGRGAFVPPRSPAERELARIWAELLGLPRVGIDDNFFALGGDSILSIQFLSRALRAGIRLTPRQVFLHPTIAGLARVAAIAGAAAPAEEEAGEVPLIPIQRWFFDLDLADAHHFNQALVLAVPPDLDAGCLAAAVAGLVRHHDALRYRFSGRAREVRQERGPTPEMPPFAQVDLSALADPARALATAAAAVQASLDLALGPLVRVVLFRLGPGRDRLLIVVHHLVVDGVSWRILLDDLDAAYAEARRGGPPALPRSATSFKAWAERLAGYAGSAEVDTLAAHWRAMAAHPAPRLPVDLPGGDRAVASLRSVVRSLDAAATRALLEEVPRAYRTRIDEVLLTAVARAFSSALGVAPLLLDLEWHGREDPFDLDVDLSRTVGWFTVLHPVLLAIAPQAPPGEALKTVKEALRRTPGHGLIFGLASDAPVAPGGMRLADELRAEVSFNYLGQLDASLRTASPFRPLAESPGPSRSPRQRRAHLFDLTGQVADGRLSLHVAYSEGVHRRETVELLADRLLAALREIMEHCLAPGAGGFTPSDFPLARLDAAGLDRLVAGATGIEDVYPLSPLQHGLLFHSLLDVAAPSYVEQMTWTLRGGTDLAALAEAWRWLVARHAALRTAFRWRGLEEPLQVVFAEVVLPLDYEDWSGLAPADQATRLAALAQEDRRRGFDLERAPLLRLRLRRTSATAVDCIWSFHHLLLDGWSLPVLFAELGTVYRMLCRGEAPRLDPAPRFRDYIRWLQRQDLGQAEAFWRRDLAGLSPQPLATGRALAATPAAVEASQGMAQARLDATLTGELRRLARGQEVTLNVLLQGAFALLLARHCGTGDVVFGITLSGRSVELPGVESTVGLFINTLPLRVGVPAERQLGPWLAGLQEHLAAIVQLSHSPLAAVQRWSGLPGGVAVFDHLLVFENYPIATALDAGEAGFAVADLRLREATHYPLTLALGPGDRLLARLSYDRRLFEAAAMQRFAGHFATLLAAMAARPDARLGDLDLLTAAERQQLAWEWNDTAAGQPARLLPELFALQARRRPDQPALAAGEERLTYRDLDHRSGRLARRLRRRGIGLEERVALVLPRSADLVLGLLAVQRAGGVAVPIDTSQPAARQRALLADAAPRLVLCHGEPAAAAGWDLLDPRDLAGPAEDAPESAPEDAPERTPVAGALAYMIYTSGSTGQPKAVMVEHGSLANILLAAQRSFGFGPADVMLSIASFAFDISQLELWSPLLGGGRCVLLTHQPAFSMAELLRALGEATVLHAVPTLLGEVLAAIAAAGGAAVCCPRLRLVLTGGDRVPADLLDAARAALAPARVEVLYGPTEATIICSHHAAAAAEEGYPIGRPCDNLRLDVVGFDLRPLPIGVAGELWIGGLGTARGYWRRPELTAERFVPDAAGRRRFRSGDLARQRPDGSLLYLERIDQQVKVRGFRVEPGEVESCLCLHPAVRQAVVTPFESGGERRLAAYVVAAPGASPTADELRRFLAQRLPEPFVPAVFVPLAALPQGAHGKVDRRALPDPSGVQLELAVAFTAPEGEIESALAALWREVLRVERVGARDNFFDLGGHSLHLVRMHGALAERWGEVPIVELFRHPTVRSLAEYLAALGRRQAGEAAPAGVPAGAAVERGRSRGEGRRATQLQRHRRAADRESGEGAA